MTTESASQELRRLAYLDAMGVETYVSRGQLPGAAPTLRQGIVSFRHPAQGPESSGAVSVSQAPPIPRLEVATPARSPASNTRSSVTAVADVPLVKVPRFSLTAIEAGSWLWIEELAGMPLTTEQVQLVGAMAGAMEHARGSAASAPQRPQVLQFDWPIHSNHQLDQGEEAARAAVAGFIGRKFEESGCAGLVMMGQACVARVPDMAIRSVKIDSSATILQRPDLKLGVWRALLTLVTPS